MNITKLKSKRVKVVKELMLYEREEHIKCKNE